MSEHCIFVGFDHGAADTAKIFETVVVSEEMGNELHQAFGYKASFQYDLASHCAVHDPPGPWSRNSNFRLRLWLQHLKVFCPGSKII